MHRLANAARYQRQERARPPNAFQNKRRQDRFPAWCSSVAAEMFSELWPKDATVERSLIGREPCLLLVGLEAASEIA